MTEPTHPPGDDDPQRGAGADPPAPDADPELAALARMLAASDDPLAKLLRPLPDEAADRLVRRALDAASAAKAAPERAKVLALAPRPALPRWAWLAAAAFLGVAALLVTQRRHLLEQQRTAYVLEIKGDAELRGDGPSPAGPIRLRPSTRLRVRLAPSVAVRDKGLRVLVLREGKARLLEGTPYAVAADGALTIDAPAREALGDQPDGPAELVFVVGRELPGDDEVKQLAEDRSRKPGADFDLLRQAVVFEGWGSTRRSSSPEEMGFSGCEAVVAGPICEVSPGAKLRLWAPGERGDLALAIDDRPLEAQRERIEEGTRFTLDLPAGARLLTLTASSGEVVFRLPLRAAPSSTALREARALMQKNQLDAAEKKLAEAESGGQAEVALQALRVRARIARRRGDGTRMKALFEQAIAAEHAAGRISDEAEDRQLRAYQAMVRDADLAAAHDDLFGTFALEAGCPECRVDGDYYRGMLAGETGRLHEALRWLRRASVGARRLGLDAQEMGARNQLVDSLALLGRHREARALIDLSLREAASAADPCVRARLITTAAWVLFRGADRPGSAAEAASTAAEAVAVARERCPADLAGTLVNQAFTELSTRKLDLARAHLDEARRAALPGDARLQTWADALALELDLADRPEAALRRADALQNRGEQALSPELLFRAAAGRARALDALGRGEEARVAAAEAEAALDHWSALVPLGEGRQGFFAEQERWSRSSLDLHVRLAEAAPAGSAARDEAVRRAAAVARRSIARFFDVAAGAEQAQVAEQSAYAQSRAAADRALAAHEALPRAPEAALQGAQARALAQATKRRAEPLAAPEPGTLTLTYHPLVEGWVGIAVAADGRATLARLAPLDPLDPDRLSAPPSSRPDAALAQVLLAPFAEAIAGATTLRVPAQGPLRHVPFEALPWRDATLSRFVNIVYGFDAPEVEAPAASASSCLGAPRALLITDPRGDLRGAASAGPTVRDALARRGFAVTWLEGRAARREAALTALADPCTQLFHYDGHARFEGLDGLRAALDLDDAPLTVSDLLALPRVPRAAVLLGCATAKDDGLGLAQALLARGAREVLASTDDVDDTLSRRVAEQLYEGAPLAGAPALAPALRAALAPQQRGAAPWWLLRVLAR